MTPQTVLGRSLFGPGWTPSPSATPISRKASRIEAGQLNPKALQGIISPDELVGQVNRGDSERADAQLSALTLTQILSAKSEPEVETPAVVGQLELALSETAENVLGPNGVRRFEEFVAYERGWDLGQGEPLSARSVAFVNAFLDRLPELAAVRPSLFLTDEGSLQLGWEDREGNTIEIEFGSETVEYYLERFNEERTIGLEALPHFIGRVRSLVE